MALWTSNAYGNITITDEVVASIASRIALDCYGVVDVVSKSITDTIADLFRRSSEGKGVRINTKGDRVFIDVYVVLKYGTSINAVANSLKNSIKFGVENFTSMIVDSVNIHVVGVKI
ncbi:MAG: Asp23/Gls24 family envelope stress response protein [Clostridia bacterium]|nr:Asp23/Gls24 family envelope stress response protein [Clostridia bacterium]